MLRLTRRNFGAKAEILLDKIIRSKIWLYLDAKRIILSIKLSCSIVTGFESTTNLFSSDRMLIHKKLWKSSLLMNFHSAVLSFSKFSYA